MVNIYTTTYNVDRTGQKERKKHTNTQKKRKERKKRMKKRKMEGRRDGRI
jgi:hypothetical protein